MIDIKQFWKVVLEQDRAAIKEFFHEKAYVNWHCTNEHFTVDEFILANCEYPGEWDGTIERVECMGDLLITATHVFPKDKSASCHVISFFHIENQKIISVDEYWSDDGEAPSWRKEMHIGKPINTGGKRDSIIREMRKSEYPMLNDFLYEAIFIPQGEQAPLRSIINTPPLQVYVSGFGCQEHDRALVAEVDGKVVGAVWVRIMEDYGHVDDRTPSVAISLYKEYRGYGIGTAMMKEMLSVLKKCGYEQVSLSVQKANYAVKMYRKLGFEIIIGNGCTGVQGDGGMDGESEKDGEYIMVKRLQS